MHNTAHRAANPNSDSEQDRQAYNAAFNELGLNWFWDAATHQRLQASTCERERIRIYLTHQHAHLLKAYDADFLVNAIHTNKQKRVPSVAPHVG